MSGRYIILKNRLSNHFLKLSYVTESANWSIKWDGKYITENLNKLNLTKARTTTTSSGIKNQIIHFGSVNTFKTLPHESNKVVVTWFHLVPDYSRIKYIKEAQKYVDIFHTSSNITKSKLIEIGIPEEKIVVIPLGVDLDLFKPVTKEEKERIKRKLGLPTDKIIIGSFQKDGVGWAEGLEPKWVKGPDTFVEVVDKLNRNYNIFVLLTGPARGYVKRELDRIGVPYKHLFLKNYLQIPKYYNALDLYLVASRTEGGPKAIVEAMAAGVPVVSTKVGMAPDIIKEGYNGLLAEIEDVATLSEKASKILDDGQLAKAIAKYGLVTVKDYSWKKIATRYYEIIYNRFLNS